MTIEEVEKWMSNFYINPQPELIPQVLEALSKEGKLSDENTIVPIIYFFCHVFRDNSQEVEKWTSPFMTRLSLREQEILVTAIGLSNTPTAKNYLNSLSDSIPELKEYIKTLFTQPFLAIEKMPIEHPAILDALWSSFMATGQEKYVVRIIAALGYFDNQSSEIEKLIGNAAKWSLRSNIKNHPKVKLICKKQLTEQTNEITSILEGLLKD